MDKASAPQKVLLQTNSLKFLKERELGISKYYGREDCIKKSLYNSFDRYRTSERSAPTEATRHGLLTLEFNPSGRLLVAGGEEKKLLFFDTNSKQKVETIMEAHAGFINGITFMDDNTFATCSNDTYLKFWDIRQTTFATHTFHAGIRYAKNITYSASANVIITSGNDGNVYIWHIPTAIRTNTFKEEIPLFRDPIAAQFSSDGRTLAIGTKEDYILVITDLDLEWLREDMMTFLPPFYRSPRNRYNPDYTHTEQRNRIVFLDDFANDAQVILSLQMHPSGDVIASRNVSADRLEEYMSVHNIRKKIPPSGPDKYFTRLSHFKSEICERPSLTKKISFSYDGRVISSPFGKGIRLLGFNERAQEYESCYGICSPRSLYSLMEIKRSHHDIVVATKFNPKHLELVSSCLSGDIVWYKPVF